ncbi:RNA-guided endonuclease TnpB family protein [Longispora urticae]
MSHPRARLAVVRLRYNFRLYPSPSQVAKLARVFGCVRVVFNDAVALRRSSHCRGERLSDTEIQRRVITAAKKSPQRAWLGEVSSVALIQAVGDAHAAHKNFMDSVTGGRRGRRLGPPRFRSRRDHRQSFRLTRNGFTVRPNGTLYVAKVGNIAVRWSRELPSAPSSVTVVRDVTGRYFASFVVDVEPTILPGSETEIGIDLGLSSYAVTSRGQVIRNPRFLRNHERRLRRAQREVSRKVKGSNNRAKARVKLARAHARVRDCRRDWMHKETTRLVRENQAVYLEDLAVSGLARTRMAKSVYDAGWGMFRRFLEYKAAKHGRHVGVIGRFEPTTRRCSTCGVVGDKKPLSVRSWICQHCDAHHDRDRNAARNILAAGQAERLNACGGGRRPGLGRAATGETGTRRDDIASFTRCVAGIPAR